MAILRRVFAEPVTVLRAPLDRGHSKMHHQRSFKRIVSGEVLFPAVGAGSIPKATHD